MIRLTSLLRESFNKKQRQFIKSSSNIPLKKLLREQGAPSQNIKTIEQPDGSKIQITTTDIVPHKSGALPLVFASGKSTLKDDFNSVINKEVGEIKAWFDKNKEGLKDSKIMIIVSAGSSAYWGVTPKATDKQENINLAGDRAKSALKPLQSAAKTAFGEDFNRIEFKIDISGAHAGPEWAKEKKAGKKFDQYREEVKRYQFVKFTATATGKKETREVIPPRLLKVEDIQNLEIQISVPGHYCNQAEFFIFINNVLIPNATGGITCNLNNHKKDQSVPRAYEDRDKLPGELLNPAYGFISGYGYGSPNNTGDQKGGRSSIHRVTPTLAAEIAKTKARAVNVFMVPTTVKYHDDIPVLNVTNKKDGSTVQVFNKKAVPNGFLMLSISPEGLKVVPTLSGVSEPPNINALRDQLYATRKQILDTNPNLNSEDLAITVADVTDEQIADLEKLINPTYNKFITADGSKRSVYRKFVRANMSELQTKYNEILKMIVKYQLNRYPDQSHFGTYDKKKAKALYKGGGAVLLGLKKEDSAKYDDIRGRILEFWSKMEFLYGSKFDTGWDYPKNIKQVKLRGIYRATETDPRYNRLKNKKSVNQLINKFITDIRTVNLSGLEKTGTTTVKTSEGQRKVPIIGATPIESWKDILDVGGVNNILEEFATALVGTKDSPGALYTKYNGKIDKLKNALKTGRFEHQQSLIIYNVYTDLKDKAKDQYNIIRKS